MANRLLLKYGFFAACIAIGWYASDTTGKAAESDKVIQYSQGDFTMNDAQAEAQKHLPSFLENVLDDQGVAAEGAMVKVAFPVTVDGVSGHEVIWVGPFGLIDGEFKGMLANRPRDMDAEVGDIVTFSEAMIRDWMLRSPDGRLYGSYTTRVMLKDLDKTTADQISASLMPDPLPKDW